MDIAWNFVGGWFEGIVRCCVGAVSRVVCDGKDGEVKGVIKTAESVVRSAGGRDEIGVRCIMRRDVIGDRCAVRGDVRGVRGVVRGDVRHVRGDVWMLGLAKMIMAFMRPTVNHVS